MRVISTKLRTQVNLKIINKNTRHHIGAVCNLLALSAERACIATVQPGKPLVCVQAMVHRVDAV
jgi:hypothetical protein